MDIKKIIKERGYTINQVADMMGKNRVTLSQTISRNPTVETLQKIADTIGCKVGDFFRDEINVPSTQSSTTADSARLEQRIGRLEAMVGEILEELRKQHQTDEATADSLASAIAEIKQKVSDTHQDLRYNAKNIMAECEGISQDFRDLFSLLDDKL